MPKPTVDDYRPGGIYYQSVVVVFEGNQECPPLKLPYPPDEHQLEAARDFPFFQAQLEELERRNSGFLKRLWLKFKGIFK